MTKYLLAASTMLASLLAAAQEYRFDVDAVVLVREDTFACKEVPTLQRAIYMQSTFGSEHQLHQFLVANGRAVRYRQHENPALGPPLSRPWPF
jgi:tRNA(Met) C34 N-acetyltransferase TmcA